MAYMREVKGVHIEGSSDKRKLRNMGYYHGYKGYRYHNNPANMYAFKSFDEIQAIYDFDMGMKAMFYPEIMFLETAFKNYALEVILDEAKSKRFADIYAKLLTDYKAYPIGSNDYKKSIKKRMDLRNKVYSLISRDYGKRFIVNHYYDKDNGRVVFNENNKVIYLASKNQQSLKEIVFIYEQPKFNFPSKNGYKEVTKQD